MSLETAQQYEDNEQYAQAYEEYKKYFAQNPRDLGVMERLGHLAIVLGEKDEAETYYSNILEFDATNTMAYEQLMDIYADKNRYKYYVCRANLNSVEQKYEHAINDYKKALSQAKEDSEILAARFVLATLYEQAGNNAKAADEYLRVLDFEDTNEEVYLKLANLYVKDGADASAADILERARKCGFDSQKVRENLALICLRTGNPQQAMELTQDDFVKATALLDLGQTDDAWKIIEKSNFADLKARYYYETGDNEKALAAVDEFEKQSKNAAMPHQMRALVYESLGDDFNAHLSWGKFHVVRGNKDIAVNEFLEAYRINPNDADLTARLAAIYDEMGDKHYAVEFYEKLAKLEPNNKMAAQKLEEYGNEECFLDKIFGFLKG